MTTIYLYKVITVDNEVQLIWTDEAPKVGKNGEQLKLDQTSIEEILNETQITVNEPTKGYFQATTVEIDAPINTPKIIKDISFPMDILLWKTDTQPTEEMIGDSVCVIIDPDRSIGKITDDVLVGENKIKVGQDILDSVVLGFDVSLDDKVNKQDFGRIIDIDLETSTLTVENNAVRNFYAASDTVLLLNICMVRDVIFDQSNSRVIFGEKGFRSKLIEKDAKIRIIYNNNNGAAKKLYWKIEYYFGWTA